MLPTYLHARDHLQRAAVILQGNDSRSRQLRYIIERTVSLIDEFDVAPTPAGDNILDFAAFRARAASFE